FIEKEATINDEIDKLRHSATASLSTRRDVIIVASVSCIYALGDPSEYQSMSISLIQGTEVDITELLHRLTELQYQRNDMDFHRGTFRVRGDTLEIYPIGESEFAYRVEFFGDEIDRITQIHPLTGKTMTEKKFIMIFPASHYATGAEKLKSGVEEILSDLGKQVDFFKSEGKLLEAQRLEQRTNYDVEMIKEIGYCQGIENYSRYFDGRRPGQPPFTLLDYFPDDFLIIIDESHVTVPQIRAMYAGDRSRKDALVGYGFRLPSAYDNRPLKFAEFEKHVKQLLCVSATPADYELSLTEGCVTEQIIRPTGLLDPPVCVRPVKGQVDDLLGEIKMTSESGMRTLVTTLTKRMAEELTEYLVSFGIKVRYMHSEIETMERMEIIRDLRLGEFDVLVGINLLREGLDLPEVGLIAILDADKEGFLRSTTSLIQTIGRAARNAEGRVIMYADTVTDSMQRAITETERRREIQKKYNEEHGIVPQSIIKPVYDVIEVGKSSARRSRTENVMSEEERQRRIEVLKQEMQKCAMELEFEQAAKLRDEMLVLMGKSDKKSGVAPGTVGSRRRARERKRK
ncbi:MAG: excinuclease ABC subunit UvrB, partial [Clostridia bacterium]|nr:excinuclease ABC subunit UvrB [Clostridia bacterium]